MPERRFDDATEGMLRAGRPPLAGLLRPVLDWLERRHLELMADAGFDDVRRAHNAVFVNLPAGGRRLTELAEVADMSKQAMGELVDDLVGKGYLARTPDPTDGRAKLIVWGERGERAHRATLAAFARIEAEVGDSVGHDQLDELHAGLLRVVRRLPPEGRQG